MSVTILVRGRALVVATAVALGSLMPVASMAAATPKSVSVATEAAKPKVTVKLSKKKVTEGDVLKVTAHIGQRSKAKRVTLQLWEPPPYSWTTGRWVTVKSRKAKAKVVFKTTVTTKNHAKYRVSVTYKKRTKPVVSKSATAVVWRWEPLRNISSYYSTTYAGFSTARMNGRSYPVWGSLSYGSPRAWESRFTPGRNCTAFRGVAGLTDTSDDGSAGVIELIADSASVWRSPRLVPGATVPFKVSLSAKPYRISLLASNTSEDPITTDSHPVIGDPELYCTGI